MPEFDLTTVHRDPKTQQIVKFTPYRLHVNGTARHFERNGILYNRNGALVNPEDAEAARAAQALPLKAKVVEEDCHITPNGVVLKTAAEMKAYIAGLEAGRGLVLGKAPDLPPEPEATPKPKPKSAPAKPKPKSKPESSEVPSAAPEPLKETPEPPEAPDLPPENVDVPIGDLIG